MSIFAALSHLMPDTITVEPRSGEVNGTPTYGSGASLTPCQVVHGTIRFTDNQGNTIDGEGYVIAAPDAVVSERSRLTLPARLGSRKVLVSKVQVWPDALGNGCLQVIYG